MASYETQKILEGLIQGKNAASLTEALAANRNLSSHELEDLFNVAAKADAPECGVLIAEALPRIVSSGSLSYAMSTALKTFASAGHVAPLQAALAKISPRGNDFAEIMTASTNALTDEAALFLAQAAGKDHISGTASYETLKSFEALLQTGKTAAVGPYLAAVGSTISSGDLWDLATKAAEVGAEDAAVLFIKGAQVARSPYASSARVEMALDALASAGMVTAVETVKQGNCNIGASKIVAAVEQAKKAKETMDAKANVIGKEDVRSLERAVSSVFGGPVDKFAYGRAAEAVEKFVEAKKDKPFENAEAEAKFSGLFAKIVQVSTSDAALKATLSGEYNRIIGAFLDVGGTKIVRADQYRALRNTLGEAGFRNDVFKKLAQATGAEAETPERKKAINDVYEHLVKKGYNRQSLNIVKEQGIDLKANDYASLKASVGYEHRGDPNPVGEGELFKEMLGELADDHSVAKAKALGVCLKEAVAQKHSTVVEAAVKTLEVMGLDKQTLVEALQPAVLEAIKTPQPYVMERILALHPDPAANDYEIFRKAEAKLKATPVELGSADVVRMVKADARAVRPVPTAAATAKVEPSRPGAGSTKPTVAVAGLQGGAR